ncbi:hypothetical protein HT746_15515 [Burkholderia pyrrocinia]|uniref:hypothetical protein n=1 Tax=Burkholderia pyrrocinia TaxID=60550 RepID=UPI0015754EB1|nr:hypothetical protein [Burkholderia pyrrocinia]NTX28520.1 hypothetical protein [Burkholderia pyrrocinia]
MLDVSFIARSTITAAVVDQCATLALDAARATVPPINDHDSVPPVIDAIVLYRDTWRWTVGKPITALWRAWLPWPLKFIAVRCV